MTEFFPPHPIPPPSGERRKVRGILVIWTLVIGIYLEIGIWLLKFNLLGRTNYTFHLWIADPMKESPIGLFC